MKQILRILNRLILVLPALVLQGFWYYIIFVFASRFSFYLTFATNIISFLVVLFIVNHRGEPNYRIIWLIIILSLPVIGCWLYILFGNRRSSKGIDKLIKYNEKYNKVLPFTSEDIETDLKNDNYRLAQTMIELSNESNFPIYRCNETKFYSLGEEMFKDILEELNNAKEFIYIEYFIVEKGLFFDSIYNILKQKVNEGVKVYFMFDDFGSILTFSNHTLIEMENNGINCCIFNPTITIKAAINNRDHRKMVIVDNKVCFSGGINLADEYINHVVKFGHWKDIGFKIVGACVDNFSKMFIELWNCYSKDKLINNLEVTYLKDDNHGYLLSYYDSPHNEVAYSNNLYVDLMSQAQKYIWIYTPYLIPSEEIINSLIMASKRGVDVRLILPGVPDKKIVYRISKSYFKLLIDNGVKIYLYTAGFVHAKALLIDDDICTIGTVNLDSRSLFLHFENNTLFYKNNVSLLLKDDFNNYFNKCELVKIEEIKTGFLYNLINNILRLIAPLC